MFLRRLVLRNFKSIANCDLTLGPLTYLVGPNGAGKSNVLDALRLLREALNTSLDHALSVRGGIREVRRKTEQPGHPIPLGMRLEIELPDGRGAVYAFDTAPLAQHGYQVVRESCLVGAAETGHSFSVERGQVVQHSGEAFPQVTADRLALVAASGLAAFAPVYDALSRIGIYNLSPNLAREPQRPQEARMLHPSGENLASVIAQLSRQQPQDMELIQEYLRKVVPSIESVARVPVGPFETLEFRQGVDGSRHAWRFPALNMSDGTLRALGVLVALFQRDGDRVPSLVGIEEPETALHPAAAAVLRTALQEASQHTQVIVTSHSPELLDDPEITADQLRAVANQDGATVVAAVDEAARDMLRQRLFSAGELLKLDQLQPDPVHVEAQSRQGHLFTDLP